MSSIESSAAGAQLSAGQGKGKVEGEGEGEGQPNEAGSKLNIPTGLQRLNTSTSTDALADDKKEAKASMRSIDDKQQLNSTSAAAADFISTPSRFSTKMMLLACTVLTITVALNTSTFRAIFTPIVLTGIGIGCYKLLNYIYQNGFDILVSYLHYRTILLKNRKKPKRILLIRHGQSEGNVHKSVYANVPDHQISLTHKGIMQALKAGERLKSIIGNENVLFYVSPYRRSLQTYQLIVKSFVENRTKLQEDPRIREQEWGNFQRVDEMKTQRESRKEMGRFFYRYTDGESGADVYDRVSSFMENMFEDMSGNVEGLGTVDNMVIVSHGLFMRLFLMRFFRWTVEKFNSIWNFNNCEYVLLEKNEDGIYELKTDLKMKWKVELPKQPEIDCFTPRTTPFSLTTQTSPSAVLTHARLSQRSSSMPNVFSSLNQSVDGFSFPLSIPLAPRNRAQHECTKKQEMAIEQTNDQLTSLKHHNPTASKTAASSPFRSRTQAFSGNAERVIHSKLSATAPPFSPKGITGSMGMGYTCAGTSHDGVTSKPFSFGSMKHDEGYDKTVSAASSPVATKQLSPTQSHLVTPSKDGQSLSSPSSTPSTVAVSTVPSSAPASASASACINSSRLVEASIGPGTPSSLPPFHPPSPRPRLRARSMSVPHNEYQPEPPKTIGFNSLNTSSTSASTASSTPTSPSTSSPSRNVLHRQLHALKKKHLHVPPRFPGPLAPHLVLKKKQSETGHWDVIRSEADINATRAWETERMKLWKDEGERTQANRGENNEKEHSASDNNEQIGSANKKKNSKTLENILTTGSTGTGTTVNQKQAVTTNPN